MKRIICFFITSLFLSTILIKGVFASEFNPYASIRFYAGYNQKSKEMTEVGRSDTDMIYDLAPNTRFGAKFKQNDKLSGQVEIGFISSPDSDSYLRLAYAEYDFGSTKLQVGQDYTDYTLYSAAVANSDAGMTGFGIVRENKYRIPLIKLSARGAFLALMKPETFDLLDEDYVDEIIPRINVGYNHKSNARMVGAGAAYMMYKIDDPVDGQTIKDGERVVSYLLYAHSKITVDMVSVQFNVGYGTNLKQFGISSDADYSAVVKSDRKVEDTKCLEGYIQLGFKLGDSTIYTGYGYGQSDNGEWAEKDTQQAYFVNAKIPLGNLFFVQPEFLFKDYMKDSSDADEGNEWYLGAKFQMDLK